MFISVVATDESIIFWYHQVWITVHIKPNYQNKQTNEKPIFVCIYVYFTVLRLFFM